MTRRLVVGISGSSGVILGIRLLQALRGSDVETHLVLTPSARLTIAQETDWRVEDVLALATRHYNPHDIGAAIASGSFATLGMVVIPCSIKSLSAIANSYSADLLSRAADVTLKEGRPLLLVVRETPLHRGHIHQMDLAAAAGAILFPPVPAFYTRPKTVDELVDQLVGRILARLGLENDLYRPWNGLQAPSAAPPPVGVDLRVDPERAHSDPGRTHSDPGRTHRCAPTTEIFEDPSGVAPEILALPALTLATSDTDGTPHAAPVYFAADAGGRLYFFSDPDSQHARNLLANPRAAAAIHPLVSGWQAIRGLQLRGSVRPIPPGPEWDAAWDCYLAKFPFVEQLKESVTRSTLYAFEPDWVRWMDNRKGFGYKEEKSGL
jgi:4-hydroxy-3-polyprenylbenzoate decarboxylase